MFFQRLIRLYKRRKAAKVWGVPFPRTAWFNLPTHLTYCGTTCPLYLPNENGVKAAFIELFLDDCYRCGPIADSVKTVLDIGANVGLFSFMAREIFPAATIHAYEPNHHLEKYLKAQAQNGGFQYFMEAVGCVSGKVTLDYNQDSVQTRSFQDNAGSIRQTAFRDAIDRIGGHVDFVKMDCEGAEWDIFKDVTTWQTIRYLSMEYHLWDDHTAEDALTQVKTLGFSIISHTPHKRFGLIVAARQPF